jgi:Ca2+-binding RTX toxin-like protein
VNDGRIDGAKGVIVIKVLPAPLVPAAIVNTCSGVQCIATLLVTPPAKADARVRISSTKVSVPAGARAVATTAGNLRQAARTKMEKVPAVEVTINSRNVGTFLLSEFDTIVVQGGEGDDRIRVDAEVKKKAILLGAGGNDHLFAGGGPTVLVGGDGDDRLFGGKDRNVLIGGRGADRLLGKAGDDLLIGGTTEFDSHLAALWAILAEWDAERKYDKRVSNLKGPGDSSRLNGNYFLIDQGAQATVHDDGEIDRLRGGSGRDWFFAELPRKLR